jgi:hypothetical protein
MFLAMNRRAHYAVVLSASLGILIFGGRICAQAPLCEQSPSSMPSDSREVKIHVESVEFTRDDDLTAIERSKITKEIQKQELSVGIDEPEDRWLDEFQEAKHLLQDQGYFKASLELVAHLIRAEENERHYALTVRDIRGPQYRLGHIRFESSTVFGESDLRNAFTLRAGDIFDVSAIREGLQSVGKMYGSRGYIDETPEPIETIDEESKKIDLVIRLDEGKQYHIGRVDLSGLNPRLQLSLASLLKTGQVFDAASYSRFSEAIEPGPKRTPETNKTIRITRNAAEATIDVVVESGKCSEI